MCIIGCAPKLKFYDFLRSVRDQITDLDNINSPVYHIEQIKILKEEIIKLISDEKTKEFDKINETIKSFIRQKIKKVNFFMNDFLYQGCLIYCKGKTYDEDIWTQILTTINFSVYHGREDVKTISNSVASLRPTNLNLISKGKKDELDIRLIFVFSHNKYIKSYFYSREDWIHLMCPKLSIKYLKQNKDMKRDDWDDGIKTFFIDSLEEIDSSFIEKLKEYDECNYPITILCKGKEVFKELKNLNDEIKLKRWIVTQGSWI
jgi:hypothetical protein